LEKDKYNNIKKVIDHNGGTIIEERSLDNDIHLRVKKIADPKD
jgi:hypothetical protein